MLLMSFISTAVVKQKRVAKLSTVRHKTIAKVYYTMVPKVITYRCMMEWSLKGFFVGGGGGGSGYLHTHAEFRSICLVALGLYRLK